jgi:hypothetical protein
VGVRAAPSPHAGAIVARTAGIGYRDDPMRRRRLVVIASLSGVIALRALAVAAGDVPEPASTTQPAWPRLSTGPLQDNSFFLEEAYNQEAGVVQHIGGAQRDQRTHRWVATFTQEWPLFGVDHQLSYLVPYQQGGDGEGESGVGDVLLNYRYQLLLEGPRRPACAPRVSLILPTGSVRKGLGTGSAGVQTNVAVSKQIDDHWAAHLNVGATFVPNAATSSGPPRHESLTSWQGGGSVIWESADAINLLCEVFASSDAEVGRHGIDHGTHATVSPGIRVAWNGPAGTQWVWGIAGPIGLTRKTDDVGVFLYFSLEHAFTAAARRERWP